MRKHKLTDDLEIHFIELPKWHKGDIEKMNRLEHWLAYLSPKTTNEERRRLAMKDPAIQKVMEAEKVFLADPDCITAYEQHEKYLRDMAAMKEYDEEVGWERGHAAGLAEGRMEERIQLVLKCYRESMSAAAIARLLDLEEAEVQEIIRQYANATDKTWRLPNFMALPFLFYCPAVLTR